MNSFLSMVSNFFKREVSLKTILAVLIGLYLAALSGVFAVRGPNSLFDGTTAMLGLVLGLVVLAALWATEGYLFAQVAMLAALFLPHVYLRLLSYGFVPDSVTFPFGQGIGSRDINTGLSYVLMGTILIFAGMWAADVVALRFSSVVPAEPEGLIKHPIGSILAVFVVVSGIDWGITVWTGVGPFGKLQADKWNTAVQVLRGLFDSDMAFFIAFVALLFARDRNSFVIVLLASVYIFVTAFMGSRGVAIRVLMMLLAILLCLKGIVRVTIGKFCAVLLCLVIAGVALYPVATQVRLHRHLEVNKALEKGWMYDQFTSSGTDLYSRLPDFSVAVVNRLGADILDYAVLVLTQPGDPEAKSKYMTVTYSIKSIVNYCVPGILFHDADISTSRVMGIIYRGFTEDDVHRNGYYSEIWTAWGLSYVLFGYWGGLAALFLAGAALHFGYHVIMLTPSRWRLYGGAFYLWLIPKVLYDSSGLDHSVTTTLVRLLQGTIALWILHGLTAAWIRLRQTLQPGTAEKYSPSSTRPDKMRVIP